MLKFFSNLKIRTQILSGSLGVILLILPWIMVYIFIAIGYLHYDNVYEIVQNKVEISSHEVCKKVNYQVAVVRSLASIMKQNIEENNRSQERRTYLNQLIRASMDCDSTITGMWTCWEPNAIDGEDAKHANTEGHDATGRFIPFFSRNNGAINITPLKHYEQQGEGDFYRKVRESRVEVVSEPFWYEVNGQKTFLTSIAVPIISKGKFMGAIGVNIPISKIQNILNTIDILGSNIAAVYSSEGTIVAHYITSKVGQPVATAVREYTPEQRSYIMNSIANNKKFQTEINMEGTNKKLIIFGAPILFGKTSTPWGVLHGIPKETMLAEVSTLVLKIIGLAAIALILMSFVLFYTANHISSGIKRCVSFVDTIATGDLTATILENDLLGKGELGILNRSANEMRNKMNNAVEAIATGADSVATASSQMMSGNQTVAQGASEQASSVEEISSAIEEMTANIEQNSENAQQAESIAKKVVDNVRATNTASGESLAAIKEIASKINVINDIAFQTNLLALNAAVEAARAGEQGRGFAVVASEVRRLAEHSTAAANEIVVLAKHTVEVTQRATDMMSLVVPEIEKSGQLVQEISSASAEQSNGARQVNDAAQQLNKITQQNATVTEEMVSSTEMLNAQAQQMKEIVSFYKINKQTTSNTPSTSKHTLKPQHTQTKTQPTIKATTNKNVTPKTTATPQSSTTPIHKAATPTPAKKTTGVKLNLGKSDDSNYERY